MQSHVHVDYGVDPTYASLSFDEQLDRSMSIAGIQGVVQGKTGSPAVHRFQDENVTDYPFNVQSFVGHPPPPFRPGETITLRILGGCTPDLASTFDDAPALRPDEELFVFVSDAGDIGGGNTGSRLVAASASDVFELRDGIVLGQDKRNFGHWSQFAEPVSEFVKHFQR